MDNVIDFFTNIKNKFTGTSPAVTDLASTAPNWGATNNNTNDTSTYPTGGGSRRCTKKHKHAGACNKMKGRKGKRGRKSYRKRH